MALCSNPYMAPGNFPAPCGKCKGCLVNRKRLWTHRMILEAYAHEKNCFITLTYSDENLPEGNSLSPETLKKYFYRLRQNIKPARVRYYAVGEYGTSGGRGINPHYHICAFGLGEEDYYDIARSWLVTEGERKGQPLGFVHVGSFTPQSAAYVAGYVQKKSEYNKQMYDEMGLYPEFARMSNRPGIGGHAIKIISDVIASNLDFLTETGDVPISLKHGEKIFPLGNYLREKLRMELGLDHTLETWMDVLTGEIFEKRRWHGKELQKKLYKAEMSALQKNEENPDEKLPPDATVSLKKLLAYKNKQATINFEKRLEIFKKGKIL